MIMKINRTRNNSMVLILGLSEKLVGKVSTDLPQVFETL